MADLKRKLRQKEGELASQEEQHKAQVQQLMAMERAQRQKIMISHKNESRTMAALLHEVSA